MRQQTLKNVLKIEGIGLHSGSPAVLTVSPAPADAGIVFVRFVEGRPVMLSARYNRVTDTRNCTCLGLQNAQVSTIEHLMAALYAAGVDNALIESGCREVPIMDGSADEFYRILKNADKTEQKAPRHFLKVCKEVALTDDKGNSIRLTPSQENELSVRFEIEFPSKIVGKQVFDRIISPDVFEKEIAPCRTFCEKSQIDYLRSLGLIKGGSLGNAVVLDGDSILNPEGFRLPNECVNHKVLDALGDLYTSGYFIFGHLDAYHTGHYHNNELLKKLFADPANYRIL
jgi:UDP-3-O-[3-hydroxymyristoyl] N-acetylglucosamine deacetylase